MCRYMKSIVVHINIKNFYNLILVLLLEEFF